MTAAATSIGDAVEELLHREAELLDLGDLDAWLDLYAAECLYWIPLTPTQTDPNASPSHVYDTRDTLAARILRLQDPTNFPQQPPSRSSRLLGRIKRMDRPANAEIGVKMPFHLIECLPHQETDDGQRVFAGTLTFGLVTESKTLKIRSKRIDLLNSDKGLHGVSIII